MLCCTVLLRNSDHGSKYPSTPEISVPPPQKFWGSILVAPLGFAIVSYASMEAASEFLGRHPKNSGVGAFCEAMVGRGSGEWI